MTPEEIKEYVVRIAEDRYPEYRWNISVKRMNPDEVYVWVICSEGDTNPRFRFCSWIINPESISHAANPDAMIEFELNSIVALFKPLNTRPTVDQILVLMEMEELLRRLPQQKTLPIDVLQQDIRRVLDGMPPIFKWDVAGMISEGRRAIKRLSRLNDGAKE